MFFFTLKVVVLILWFTYDWDSAFLLWSDYFKDSPVQF